MRVSRKRWCVLFLFSCLILACAAPSTVNARSVPEIHERLSGSLVVEGASLLMEGQVQAAQVARRTNPVAVMARAASATIYRGMGARAAEKLADKTFHALIAGREGGPPPLAGAERITGYVNAFTADVNLAGAGAERALVESTAPMAIRGSSGVWTPVDVGLRRAGGGFVGVKPLVPVRLPERLSEGARLTSLGLSVTPVDAHGKPLAGSQSVVDGSSVFMANTLPDSDSVLKLSTYGFSIDTVLRSEESPEALSFRVGLPRGAHLQKSHGRAAAVSVVRQGATIAQMAAPAAVDSTGVEVPLTVTVKGDTVTVGVTRRPGAYSYPIDVDPEFNYLVESKTSSSIWPFSDSKAGAFSPLYLYGTEMAIIGGTYAAGDWGALSYVTKGDTKLYEINASSKVEPTQGNGTEYWLTQGEDYIEFLGSDGSELRQVIAKENVHLTEWPIKSKACPWSSCTGASGANGNAVSFVERATVSGSSPGFQLRVEPVSVSIAQPKETHSTVTYNKSAQELEYTSGGKLVKTPNVFYGGGGWIGPNSGAFEFKSEDAGLGVSATAVEVLKGATWEKLLPRNYLVEGGACIGIQCASAQKEVVTYSMIKSALANGNNTVRVAAHDPMANTWSSEHGEGEATLKVDAVAPHGIVLSGLPEKEEIYEVDETGGARLKVEASDGEGAASSGIRSIAIAINGKEVGKPNGYCALGPCTATGEWIINGGEIGGGIHSLTVTATDNAGNVLSEESSLLVHHAGAVATGPGSVNLESGNFELSAKDVDMSGGMGSLKVDRTYDSRNTQAGAEGPLGPQWAISLGSMASLEVLPDKSVTVLGPEGTTHFTKKGSGFESPPGDTNLKLEAVEVGGKITAYLLKKPTDGTTTKFTLPSGAGVWMPTVSEGPVATSTTTDEYTTAEPESGKKIVEPTLEVAPHPSATCTFKKLEKGCRALEFNYAASTTATGESQSAWGDYKGRLTRVYFIAWDPAKKEMTTTTVAQYSYDTQGRLRAEWDPRISPALKTIYGYDSEGHVTALTPPGFETWAFIYGPIAGDATGGRLLRIARAPATAALWGGSAPTNTALPTVTPVPPQVGVTLTATSGTWNGSPLAYRYQWQRCSVTGEACAAITGAQNETYKPSVIDAGHELKVEVQAINGGGSVGVSSAPTRLVYTNSPPTYSSSFGSAGTGNGQFQSPYDVAVDASGNEWVTDSNNNRVEEFSAAGAYVQAFGAPGTGNGQFKRPWGIALDPSGNVWVADEENNRVQEFSSTGTYIKQIKTFEITKKTETLSLPNGLAIDGSGNMWVADTGHHRVLEFSTSTGAYVTKFGTEGTGEGKFGQVTGVAVSVSGNVWVTDVANRDVQEFSPTGTFKRMFGSEGGGDGQFYLPWGIAVDSTGIVWVTDASAAADRVQEFTAYGEYLNKFGSQGTGNGQFKGPVGVAVSPSGTVYVVDTSNNRVQKFQIAETSIVSYSSKFGSGGSGNGQFSGPRGGAVDASGNVWVADTGNNRVQEFTSSGAFVRQFGVTGAGEGQMKEPSGIAFAADGNMWVTERGNHRLQEFDTTGKFIRKFGSEGSGPGQFGEAIGIAIVPGTGDIWVADPQIARMQEFGPLGEFIREITTTDGSTRLQRPTGVAVYASGSIGIAEAECNCIHKFSSTGVYQGWFGYSGSTRGALKEPTGITLDSAGNAWVVDNGNSRIQVYNGYGEYIAQYGSLGSGNGQFKWPDAIVSNNNGAYYVIDTSNDRVQELVVPAAASEGAATPATEGAAFTTVEYNVPVSGTGAPHAMSAGEMAKWSQTDTPTTATAIFPADEPVGWPASDYKRAAVYYLDGQARETNIATPSGGIATTEYNSDNDVIRQLSPANRAKALEEGSKSAEVSKLLDVQSVYGEEGTRLTEVLGPQHMVKIANGNEKVPTGSEVLARNHMKYYYDEGAPTGGETYNLVTKTTDGAETASKEEFDVRTSTTSYAGQSNLGWTLRAPTSTTIDPSGLKITHTTIYDSATGNVVETRGAASAGAGDPRDVVEVYYTAEANSSYPTCGGHIEWAGLPCETLPGKQPETSGLPALPVTTTTYNLWDQPEVVTESFGATTRTKKTSFDSAERPVTSEVTSTTGTAVPAVTDHYSESTGRLVKKSETFEGKEKTITTTYDRLGEIEFYEDSDGGITYYKYDVDGRLAQSTMYAPVSGEERGKQTYTYDATTGFLTTLTDSEVGTFKATYDVSGQMLTAVYPNKMTAIYTVNAAGERTGIEYSKKAFCATTCPENWSNDVIVPSIHGQTLKEYGTLGEEPSESYDAAGRLTEVQEIPSGQSCKTRLYGYDVESNRTSLTTRAPGAEGHCATEGGSAETHTYDSANRLTDSGVTYDTFGNITKVPAADAGGAGMEITSGYYVDNQIATQTQSGKTKTYYIDPAGRTRESRSPSVSVLHYASPGSEISWVSEPESKWTRNVPGIDGSLSATKTSGGVVTLLLHDLQGNTVGTAASDEKQTKLLTTYKSTEFGVPVNGTPPKLGWLGSLGIESESASGVVVQQGAAYVPQTGQTLQTRGLALPDPDNTAVPYVNALAPWVIEGTAAMAKQLTAAEEAQRAAKGEWHGREIGDSGSVIEQEGGAGASAVPQCEVHWKLVETEEGGGLYLSGWFTCQHHVANFELKLCLYWKYPNKPWSGGVCAGSDGSVVWKDVQEEEIAIYHPCITGIVYTGWVWGRAWIGDKKGTIFHGVDGWITKPNYPRLACGGRDPGSPGEEAEIL